MGYVRQKHQRKGYKELDPHIGIIYGDGCTLDRVKEIWRQLEELEFAANCITFGVGAFCFTALNEDGKNGDFDKRYFWNCDESYLWSH